MSAAPFARRRSTPVLVLSVRDHERSKVEALDAGADDYVTKPFGIQELLARVRAHLRRAPERTTARHRRPAILSSTQSAHTITVMGKPVRLTPKEFELLVHLARHAGKVMTHRALLDRRVGSAVGPPAGVSARVRRPVAQEARKRDRQALHPDRTVGRLPVRTRGLDGNEE